MTPRDAMATTRIRYLWDNGVEVLAARWYLRHVDVVGERVRVDGHPSITNRGRMEIGSRVRVVSTIATTQLMSLPGGILEVGERTLLNYGGSICAAEHIRIGAQCLIGTHAIIMDNDFHRIEPERRLERPASKPIAIGDNVWLGARVIVLGGVTIGDDSCVGAGSLVIDDIPPRSLAAGVPARVIREL
jgi:acetyltransferase-like isoleucine patch superfamily enzyme